MESSPTLFVVGKGTGGEISRVGEVVAVNRDGAEVAGGVTTPYPRFAVLITISECKNSR
jgi:hypothetical protein